MQPKIRLMLVEDEAIVGAAICALLEKEEHITIVGRADTAEAAVRKARLLKPDVLLLDLHLPDRSGVEVIEELVPENPAVRVLIFSAYADEREVAAAFRAGAVGYVMKSQAVTDLVQAIEQVTQGLAAMPRVVTDIILRQINHASEHTEDPPLSSVEWRVLVLVAQGFANKDIARHLSLSSHTVNAYVSSILGKLNVMNRTQAALYALRRGWVKLEASPVQSYQPAQALLALLPIARDRHTITPFNPASKHQLTSTVL
jgi:DNA-binding NarL/FixJ family response regulator